jgi:hypothetical protein
LTSRTAGLYLLAVIRRGSVLLVFACLLMPLRAAADRVDALAQALLSDGSYRVRVQAALTLGQLHDERGRPALLEALHDSSDAVRAVAAGSLGRLGDPSVLDALRRAASDASPLVRKQAEAAIAALSGGSSPKGTAPGGAAHAARAYLAVSPFAGKADPAATRKMNQHVQTELGRLPGVTLVQGQPARVRFYIDGNITRLSTTASGGSARTDCDVRVLVATFPERSIKMMATVGGSLDGTTDPKDVASAQEDCLADAAKQISEKVQAFLDSAAR